MGLFDKIKDVGSKVGDAAKKTAKKVKFANNPKLIGFVNDWTGKTEDFAESALLNEDGIKLIDLLTEEETVYAVADITDITELKVSDTDTYYTLTFKDGKKAALRVTRAYVRTEKKDDSKKSVAYTYMDNFKELHQKYLCTTNDCLGFVNYNAKNCTLDFPALSVILLKDAEATIIENDYRLAEIDTSMFNDKKWYYDRKYKFTQADILEALEVDDPIPANMQTYSIYLVKLMDGRAATIYILKHEASDVERFKSFVGDKLK